MHFLDELNKIQYDAVTEIDGPVMINAGPGSGKTRVLTYRIAFMMEQGVQPFNILALTFTNKSSREMRERIEKIVGTQARSLFMGTFHSVFARVLRTKADFLGYTNNFTIYDSDDAKSLLKGIIKEFQLNDDIYKPNVMYNRISSLKNNLINYNIYAKTPELMFEDEEANRPRFGEVFKEYTRRCFKNNAMDFDDLLIKMYELIVRYPEQLYEFQHKFQYILIDEFQDTNKAQYQIVKKIADVFQNICVVGDDSQSIYAFRGASIDNILNFKNDYPALKVFKLEQNYRSTKTIVEAANKLIKHNKNQIEKTIWTENGDGDKIKVLRAFSDNDEGKQIADEIFMLSNTKQIKYEDIAILYRTNNQSRAFEEALRRRNIPYIIYGGLSFYSRKEIKDLLAYLKTTINPNEEESLKRIINYPVRGIGDTSLNKMMLFARQENKSLWEIIENIDQYQSHFQARAIKAISEFGLMIKSFHLQQETMNAYELAKHVAKTAGMIGELYADKSVEGVSKFENLQELLNSIKEFVDNDEVVENQIMEGDKSLGSFLQSVTLLTDQDKNKTDDNTVKLMTIHASKGLEFEAVFLVGLEEKLFPSERSSYSMEDLEEERRLFYVAVTRAEKLLTMSFATSRYKYGKIDMAMPSRFLSEVPKEILDIQFATESEATQEVKPTKSYQWDNKLIATIKSNNISQNKLMEDFVPDSPDKLAQGQEVLHASFGKGKIEKIEGEADKKVATIIFGGQERRIMLKFAKLKILS
jgi:DNA helicase-2/ATP-dependent DNA helicase PcrA